jgi:hypothetical protein
LLKDGGASEELLLQGRGDQSAFQVADLLGCRAVKLKSPEHGHEEINGEQPDQDHLPQPQIARCPVVCHHLRIAIEQSLPNPKDVNATEKNDRKTDAKNNPESQDRFTVSMDNG